MSGLIRITCRDAHRLLSERMDRPLAGPQSWRLRLHLAFCDMCSRVAEQLAMMRTALRRLGQ